VIGWKPDACGSPTTLGPSRQPAAEVAVFRALNSLVTGLFGPEAKTFCPHDLERAAGEQDREKKCLLIEKIEEEEVME
jgi:hypothetical protein